MIWLAWRRRRVLVVVAAVAVGTLVGLLVHTGLDHEHERARYAALDCDTHLYQNERLPFTGAPTGPPGAPAAVERRCQQLADQLAWGDHSVGTFSALLLIVPLAVGAAFGAPLVAEELRRKTHRLVWTQSVTRTRWLLAQVAVAGAVVVVLVGAVALATGFFVHVYRGEATVDTLGAFTPRLASGTFGVSGFVPVGYGLFAFGLGTLLGTLARTTVAGALGTLVVYPFARWGATAARLAVVPTAWTAGVGAGAPDGALAVASGWVPLGRSAPAPGRQWWSLQPPPACFNDGAAAHPAAFTDRCAAAHGLHYVVRYLPDSRFWPMQALETAAFVVAGALAVAAAGWAISRLSS